MKKMLALILALVMSLSLVACGGSSSSSSDAATDDTAAVEEDTSVTIYSCLSTARLDPIREMIVNQFPDYDIVVEYMGLSELAAKLQNEGTETEIDIALDLGYVYLEDMVDLWEDHSAFDQSIYQDFMQVPDGKWYPFGMYSGCVAVNMDVLNDKGLPVPQSWEDLCDPMYAGLIQMPNPSSSGTGYIFLKMLSEYMGEEEAMAYFDRLAPNVLAFTSSGSAPLSALVSMECGIALCMTYQAALQIDEGVNLQILQFEGGQPWTSDGTAIVKGHATTAVKEVFEYIYSDCIYDDATRMPENGLVGVENVVAGFPKDITYADMGADTLEAKEALLANWKY
jgi:iron(III) transport system substrate-binding protein